MILSNDNIIQFDLNKLDELSIKDKKVIDYNTEKYNVYNRWKNDNKEIRNKALKNIVKILEKNNIEYKLNYRNDKGYESNLSVCNINDIINCLSTITEIKNIMKLYCLEKNNYSDVEYDFVNDDVDNLLYNVINNLKDKCSNIIELENEIIIVCNNTIEKYSLNIKKIRGWNKI